MSQYTELLNIEAETLSPDDDDYEEKLLEISSLFRGFGDALTDFIKEHEYKGNENDVTAKVKFLNEKFKASNIKPPRDIKDWFSPNKKISRKTAFQICFAFGLNVNETNEFFRTVQFERGFDCHDIDEAVYYFCIKNRLSFFDAQAIIGQIPKTAKIKAIPNREVLYTGTIVEYINSTNDKEKLIKYITDNIDDFKYNNTTAIGYIQKLWDDISKPNGLAEKEGSILDEFNRFEDKSKKKENETDIRLKEVVESEVNDQVKNVRPNDFVVADSNSSTWIIFSQIIGLSNYQENEFAVKFDRSLSSVLSGNRLLPLKADYCFPNRQNIDKLIRGDLVGENEIIRKMLIFLVFYTYWAKLIVDYNDELYKAKLSDSERCLDMINNYLLDAGYQELYAGNPYDWLFKWALNDEYPLNAFREYMNEVFAVKSEDTEN